MIKSLYLKNFGPHKELYWEFNPGVNVISGRSAAGKSWATLRPLCVLAKNRLNLEDRLAPGDSFVLDPKLIGEKEEKFDRGPTVIEMVVTDPFDPSIDRKVTRFKSKIDHYYRIDDNEELTFRSFGKEPPIEVLQILNMGDINIQSQFSPMYLLSMTPTEVGKVLNELAGLDLIDIASNRIESRLHSERAEKRTQEALYKKLKEELKAYARLEDVETRLAVCEELERRSQEKRQKAFKVRQLVDKVREKEAELARYHDLPLALARVEGYARQAQQAKEDRTKAASIQKLAKSLKTSEARLERLEPVGKALESVSGLMGKVEETKKLREKAKTISKLIQVIRDSERKTEFLQAEYDRLHEEFERLMPERCLLCEAPKDWREKCL